MQIKIKSLGLTITENFTVEETFKIKKSIVGDLSEEEFIRRHDEYVKLAGSSTKSKPWKGLDVKERERLLKLRLNSVVGYDEEMICLDRQPNGYYVTSETGGNNNKGWAKLFSLNDVEITDA